MNSNRLGQLIDLAMKNHFAFPQSAKRGLLCAIVIIGRALKNDDEERYWSQTVKLLVDRFNQILSGNGVVPSPHQEDVKIQIIDLLDCFIGRMIELIFPLIETYKLISLYNSLLILF